MAKQSMIQRELKREKLVKKYKSKRLSILKDLKSTSSLKETFALQAQLQRLPRNSLPVRLRNRCWKTGRSRGVYRDFGLSRHACLLPGVTKSSW